MIRERLGGVKGIIAKSALIVPAVGLGSVYGASMIDHSAARAEYQGLAMDHTITEDRRGREQAVQESRIEGDAYLASLALGGVVLEGAAIYVSRRVKEHTVFQGSEPKTLAAA